MHCYNYIGPLTDEAICRLAVSIVDACGDIFYDPSELNDPWDQEGPEGIEGATQRLLDWVTDNIEAGIREALRLYRGSGHVVVHVTPFDGESGVLLNGQVVYVAPADSQHAMSAGQVAETLANVLGVKVVEVDLRQEMEVLIEADRYDKATWDNVPSMVAKKLTKGGDK